MLRSALVTALGLGLGLGFTAFACSSDDAPATPVQDASVLPTTDASEAIVPADARDDAFLPPLAMPAGYTEIPIPNAEPKRRFTAAESVLVADQDYVAVLETTAGRIVLDLYETRAPLAVNSFVFLALHRFHEGIAFHRVLEGFVAQGGDPNTIEGRRSTWGRGGCGYTFGLEVTPGLGFGGPGVLGMARSNDPGSNGSQFFITLGDASFLDQQYSVWGKVLEGTDVPSAIVRGEFDQAAAAAIEPTRITRVGIGSKPGAVDPPLSDAGQPELDAAVPDAGDAGL